MTNNRSNPANGHPPCTTHETKVGWFSEHHRIHHLMASIRLRRHGSPSYRMVIADGSGAGRRSDR